MEDKPFKPVPVPVYILSTGFGLRFEFIELLYQKIIDAAYREYEIVLDAIKVESYIDGLDITINYFRFWAKDKLPAHKFTNCQINHYTEDILSIFAQELIRKLKVAMEVEGYHD